MSQTASLHRTPMSPRPNAGRAMFGWGISVLCHVLAVAWLWHVWLSHRPETDAGPVRRIEVRLVPLVPDVPAPAPAPTVTVPRVPCLRDRHGGRCRHGDRRLRLPRPRRPP